MLQQFLYVRAFFMILCFLAVQHERAPRTSLSSLEEFSPLPTPPVTWDLTVIPQNGMVYSHFIPYHSPYIISQNIPGISPRIQTTLNINNFTESYQYANENEVSSSQETQNRSHERNIVYAPFSVKHILSKDINECAWKLLIYTIKWTKSIPSFLQLTDKDKRILLSETWNELFVLNAIQRTFTLNDNLLSCTDHSQNKKLQEFQRKLKDVTVRFHALQVDNTEFACLKALTLFKPEAQNLQEQLHVEILQDQTQMMLYEYCTIRQNLRFGKLLLLLKSVCCFESCTLEDLFFEKFSRRGASLVQNFFMELLKQ